MAREDVEIVERLYESFRARDNATAFELMHPEIVWDATEVPIPDLGRGVFNGHEGVREFWRVWLAAWDEVDFDVELREIDDAVLGLVTRQRMHGRESGLWMDFTEPYGQLWRVRGGLVVRMTYLLADERGQIVEPD